MLVEEFGIVSGHPELGQCSCQGYMDEYGQAQVRFSQGDSETGNYVCPVSEAGWQNGPQEEILSALHRFPGFESLGWVK